MRIAAAGSGNINVLQSDAGQFRNKDFVTDQVGSFVGTTEQVAVAAQFSRVQAFNPAASGIVTLVDAIYVSLDVIGGFTIRGYSFALGTLTSSPYSRKIDAARGLTEMRLEAGAASAGDKMGLVEVQANETKIVSFDYPFELEEGKGMIVQSNGSNIQIRSTWVFREV